MLQMTSQIVYIRRKKARKSLTVTKREPCAQTSQYAGHAEQMLQFYNTPPPAFGDLKAISQPLGFKSLCLFRNPKVTARDLHSGA
jgi:hypothetical protein